MKIGRFDIVRELGRGAQSVVYLARDPQLQREIAIKTVHFTQPDPAKNKVLLAEARAVSQLRHPNLVPIFEAGEEDGDLYLVFEYVAGKTLERLIHDAGKLPAIQAVTLIAQVLDALGEAHRHGIVHRDLKPSNILIDERGNARVMDFGIAAHIEAKELGAQEFTGTPAYMAPEYILSYSVTPQTDVFAAGLVLFEMLYGRRAIPGRDVYQVMHKIANEDVGILRDGSGDVDDRMADVLGRSLARQPDQRFSSVGDFRAALEAILHPDDSAPENSKGTLEFLLRRMRHKSDFPALSESVSSINKVAQSDKDSVQKLSSTILRDFALTNKILKLVNSAYFRTAGGGSISTVSRAILVLGFDAVRNLAITVMLFEHLQKSPAKQRLMEEFVRSNFAALIARDLGKKVGNYDGELGFICGLFHSLGRILAQFYFPEEADEVRRVAQQKNLSETRASAQVLGISYEELGIGITRSWGFPVMIVGSMEHLPEGEVRKPHTIEDRLRLTSGAASDIGDAISHGTAEDRKKSFDQIVHRFGAHTGLDHAELHKVIERSYVELVEFSRVVRVDIAHTSFGKQVKAISGKGLAAALADEASSAAGMASTLGGTSLEPHAVTAVVPGMDDSGEMDTEGGGADAQSILAAGIQDISNTLVEDFKLNDILRIILETMYRAMGFRRVILCVRDAKTNAMTGRFGFGPDASEVLKSFRFTLKAPPDVFIASLTKGVDIMISNVDDDHIKARIPAWYRQAISAKTFVLLPLCLKGSPVAMIYADREHPGEIVISEKELGLLRTLRNQAVLAIKQSA